MAMASKARHAALAELRGFCKIVHADSDTALAALSSSLPKLAFLSIRYISNRQMLRDISPLSSCKLLTCLSLMSHISDRPGYPGLISGLNVLPSTLRALLIDNLILPDWRWPGNVSLSSLTRLCLAVRSKSTMSWYCEPRDATNRLPQRLPSLKVRVLSAQSCLRAKSSASETPDCWNHSGRRILLTVSMTHLFDLQHAGSILGVPHICWLWLLDN